MPRSWNLSCSACGQDDWLAEAVTILQGEDGTERVVGHPGEVRRVERWTGLSFNEVLDAGRLHYARLMACESCGAADRYRDDEYVALRLSAPLLDPDERPALPLGDPQESARSAPDRPQPPLSPGESRASTPGRADHDAVTAKVQRQYRRLLGRIPEAALATVPCKSCGVPDLRLFSEFEPTARQRGFPFVCSHCHARSATLTDQCRVS